MARTSNLNGALPTQYDPMWPSYTDLSPAQIAAFEAFPQDLIKYLGIKRWQKQIAGITVGGLPLDTTDGSLTLLTGLAVRATRDQQSNPGATYAFTDNGAAVTLAVAQALSVFDAVSGFIQALRMVEATSIAAISGGKVTSRAQIDAALSAVPTGF